MINDLIHAYRFCRRAFAFAAMTLGIVGSASGVTYTIDDGSAEYTGTWTSSSYNPDYYGSGYRYRNTGSGSNQMRWRPNIATAGQYEVYYWLPDGNYTRAANAPFTVYYSGGSQTYLVNEQAAGGSWVLLGTHNFAAGTSGYVQLTDNCSGTYVIGDAIRFVQVVVPQERIVDNSASEFTGSWTASSYQANYYATNYVHNASGSGSDKMRWRPNLTAGGDYEVSVWLPNGSFDRASNAPFTIYYNGGSQTYLVDERGTGGYWTVLGTHTFAAGTSGYVELSDNANGSYVIGDAIKFTPASGGSQVAAPGFNPGGGNYSNTQNVTVTSSTSGATIRYTLNGSTPSQTNGTIYSSPISISSTTTLKAIAYKSGMSNSTITSATYTFTSSGSPTRVASFGPNGTHWPDLIPTPFMYDTSVPNVIQVDCSWSAISSAIASVTSIQASQGVLIKVAPGNLVGQGTSGGGSYAAVLQDLGSTSWSKRVTVCPRDGYGTLTFSSGVKFYQVHGVCFAGLKGDYIKLQGCSRSALAWTKLTSWMGLYGNSGITTTQVEIVEVVQPTCLLSGQDASDAYTNGGDITGWRFDGCYTAPYYRPTGDAGHCDTLQFAGALGGNYSNMTIRDGAYFASSNCAIQTGGLSGLILNHTYIAAGSISRTRYPFLPGADTSSGQADAFINGSGELFQAIDSELMGNNAINTSTTPRPWSLVTNTRRNATDAASNQPLSGAWTVDTTMSATNPAMPPLPTDTYLNSIWAP